MNIVCFTYEADSHCTTCAEIRFGSQILESSEGLEDSEGNQPGVVFSTDEYETPICCGTCGETIVKGD